ncbi:myocardin-related transcription factor A isoform X2 [Onychostoma macrolepis]|uniref:myocardin-related transcription factor A isoform X2 n=1 Tax=Onychostoma macrolepis TaxID=369639 RepID=UPI0027299527|nr:myocardin-related transcription factor A isoform X2 [Onychostoma macrolepis]
MATMGEESSPSVIAPTDTTGSTSSPQSDAVTNELQELSLQPAPNLLPIHERKNVLQLKLQQRRTREELVNQGIMPPLKSSASFHEQRRSLERARTEDYLKRKIRSRPEKSELVRMHILEETSAEPSLQAKQLLLKRARLADDLNDKISQRPGLMELIHKNILPVHSSLKQAIIETEFPKVEAESSSFDEESSDAFSPEQTLHQDSPLGQGHLPSPPERPANETTPKQAPPPPPPPPPPLPNTAGPAPQQKLTNGTTGHKQAPALQKGGKVGSERHIQRSKKVRDNKPKVKKLKYHQYVPPDHKPEREPPPLLDSTYAKLLYQQQLFLQLQIINQQQQNYNYHTILPAPPKPPADQQPASANGPSPSKNDTPSQSTSTNLTGQNQQTTTIGGGIKMGPLPPNLDELKVAELKQELKVRGLTVSGTKNDLIERLKNFHEQNGGINAPTSSKINTPPAPVMGGVSSSTQSADRSMGIATLPFVATAERGGAQMTAPQIMQFGSTSSSPPVSPAHSERSSTGMSPDETSCNGDAFGEMVTSPLTQLSLQPSPPLPSTICIKEEPGSRTSPSSCCLVSQSAAPPIDKDQMLQEKDRRIQELTRMLLQKQQLVESLRSQLNGKRVGAPVQMKEVLPGVTMEVIRATIKEEVIEVIEESEMVTEPQVFRHAGQTQQQQQRTAAAIDLEQDQQLIMQQNQRNLQQQIHQRKRKTQKQQHNQQKQLPQALTNQQSSPVSSFPVDVLNSNSTPTIVTDSNGNQFLLTLSNQNTEAPARGRRALGKRLQSTPTVFPNQSVTEFLNRNNQSEQPIQTVILKQPIKKALKPDLNVTTNYKASSCTSISSPANIQPFFSPVDSMNDTEPIPSSPNNNNNDNEEMCVSLDQHALLSPSTLCSPIALCHQENGCHQQVDDLFDILIQRGEISENFKAAPDPVLERLRPNTPLSSSSSPLSLSRPPDMPLKTLILEPQPPSIKIHSNCNTGGGRLEDFLESTTGKPLLGVEPGGPTTLIVDLHNQMLSTPSILDHPRSPMDTCDMSFSSHSPSDLIDSAPDPMDWLELGMGGTGGDGPGMVHMNGHNSSSLFSTDFLDTSDMNWSSL